MSPITHFLAGWALGAGIKRNRRDRLCIALAGVVPDLDGLGVVVDAANHALGRAETDWFGSLHHVVLHGAFGAAAVLLAAVLLGARRWPVLLLVLASFHLHLLCDLVGSRGPNIGDIWPIHYLSPFTQRWTFAWSGQWALNAWQNVLITALLLLWSLIEAVRAGVSPVWLFSSKLDETVVKTLRNRCERWMRRTENQSPDR